MGDRNTNHGDAKAFCAVRSYLPTAGNHGENPLYVLTHPHPLRLSLTTRLCPQLAG